MTSDTNPAPSEPVDEIDRQRCMMYLLGELDSQDADGFENDLSQSAALQSELLKQSDILCSLSEVSATPIVAHSTQTLWRSIAIAALAACLMIAFVNWPTQDDTESSVANAQPEGLLIAQAWADVSVGTAPLTTIVEPEDFLENEPETDDDSSLSWMVAAMEAGAALDG